MTAASLTVRARISPSSGDGLRIAPPDTESLTVPSKGAKLTTLERRQCLTAIFNPLVSPRSFLELDFPLRGAKYTISCYRIGLPPGPRGQPEDGTEKYGINFRVASPPDGVNSAEAFDGNIAASSSGHVGFSRRFLGSGAEEGDPIFNDELIVALAERKSWVTKHVLARPMSGGEGPRAFPGDRFCYLPGKEGAISGNRMVSSHGFKVECFFFEAEAGLALSPKYLKKYAGAYWLSGSRSESNEVRSAFERAGVVNADSASFCVGSKDTVAIFIARHPAAVIDAASFVRPMNSATLDLRRAAYRNDTDGLQGQHLKEFCHVIDKISSSGRDGHLFALRALAGDPEAQQEILSGKSGRSEVR